MVIGLVDEKGTKVFSAGKLDNETDGTVSGNTLFFIGSVSKTFTALAFLDMVEHGEVKLDDPLAKYLPPSVKVPSYQGKQITLNDLATQASGLPFNPDSMKGPDERADYEQFTADKMYAFLSEYALSRQPGTEFQYSNVGMALLGRALMNKTGKDYESLIAERVCGQLLALAAEGNGDIRVLINSPGGHVESGDTIHDMIRYCGPRVKMIGTGWVASAGALVFVAAKPECRFALPNTRFLLHQPLGGVGGAASDIEIESRQILAMRERLNRIFARETKQPYEKVVSDTQRNFWMNAGEALEYGLVSRIVQHHAEV